MSGHSLPCSIYTHTVLCSCTVTSFCRVQASGVLLKKLLFKQAKKKKIKQKRGCVTFSIQIWFQGIVKIFIHSDLQKEALARKLPVCKKHLHPVVRIQTAEIYFGRNVYLLVIYQQMHTISHYIHHRFYSWWALLLVLIYFCPYSGYDMTEINLR